MLYFNNEFLWIVLLLLSLFSVTFLYKFFGEIGLVIWIVLGVILANIQVAKQIDLFGLHVTLGNIAYSLIYLATDALSEFYGKERANRAIHLSIITVVLFTIIMNVVVLFTPNEFDFASQSMSDLFTVMPKFAIVGIIVYFISQRLDIIIYHRIRMYTQSKHLWLRNNGSTLISQLVDTTLFTLLAFGGTIPLMNMLELILFSYIIKIIVAFCDTPFMYLMRYYSKESTLDRKLA